MDDFQPQPLVDEPAEIDSFTLESVPVIHGPNGARVKLSPTGKTVRLAFICLQRRDLLTSLWQVLNMAIPDWVGFVEDDKMKEVAIDTLKEYGVGTCGPSGFYGTIGKSPSMPFIVQLS